MVVWENRFLPVDLVQISGDPVSQHELVVPRAPVHEWDVPENQVVGLLDDGQLFGFVYIS